VEFLYGIYSILLNTPVHHVTSNLQIIKLTVHHIRITILGL